MTKDQTIGVFERPNVEFSEGSEVKSDEGSNDGSNEWYRDERHCPAGRAMKALRNPTYQNKRDYKELFFFHGFSFSYLRYCLFFFSV